MLKKESRFIIEKYCYESSFACIMDYKDYVGEDKQPAKLILVHDELHQSFTLEDWINFVNDCGLKCSYHLIDDTKSEVHFNPEDYVNTGHFMAAFTTVRLALNYDINPSAIYSTSEVSEYCMQNKNKYNLKPIELLQLAHYATVNYIDSLHQLMSGPSTFVDEERFLKQVTQYNSCNCGFKGDSLDKTWRQIHDLINTNVEEALKILKP